MKEEKKIRIESEEHFRMLMAGIKDYAIIILDESGLVVSWNEGAERIKGYNAHEITGQHFSKFYSKEDILKGKPEYGLKMASIDGRFEDEGWRLRKDGSRFYANVVISALTDESGKLRGFAKVTRDISERKEAERETKELKQRLSLALEAGEVGVWDYDLENSKMWRSAKLNVILGFCDLAPDWHSEPFFSFVASEHRAFVEHLLEEAVRTGHLSLECKIIRADNAIRWISSKGEIVKDAQGKPSRIVGTIVDITALREREDNEKVLAVMKEREDFIATLTHDMKNPLIGANRILELLINDCRGQLTEQQLEMLGCLKESNHGLLNLIRNVIDVYRFETDANALVLEDANLNSLVTSIVKQIDPLAKLRGINVTTELPAQMKTALMDYNAMSRVLKNLLDNALKFAPDNGNVCVRLFCSENESIVEVEDDGPGIPLDERVHLFERFSQGTAGRGFAGGSGLGLYLCKQIMKSHRGHIEVLSHQKEKGATFQFRIPLQTTIKQTSVA